MIEIERILNQMAEPFQVIAFPDLMTYSYIKKIKLQNNRHSDPAAK